MPPAESVQSICRERQQRSTGSWKQTSGQEEFMDSFGQKEESCEVTPGDQNAESLGLWLALNDRSFTMKRVTNSSAISNKKQERRTWPFIIAVGTLDRY